MVEMKPPSLLLLFSCCFCVRGKELLKPHNCSLQCIQQGAVGCEYCRVSPQDPQIPRIPHNSPFGSCVPWPCQSLLGEDACQHYVSAPRNVQVYVSDSFTHLSLNTQYAINVMALPVPEYRSTKLYYTKLFTTRSCEQLNTLDKCQKDWYPQHVWVQQEDRDVTVTFNLAPEELNIRHYFCWCEAGGRRNYTSITPDVSVNKTYHTLRLQNLRGGTNYSCEIAADITDAVTKTFSFKVKPESTVSHSSVPWSRAAHWMHGIVLILLMFVCLLLVTAIVITAIVLHKKQLKKKKTMRAEIIAQYYEKKQEEGQRVLLKSPRHHPRLLLFYSSNDGPAHVRVVQQLAAFLQQHMATHVFLDLWESLSMMELGLLAWICKRMEESDFVLVICSKGFVLNAGNREDEEPRENIASGAVAMLGEEMFRAQALCGDLSKYMTATFEYSQYSDIPTVLGLASHYCLTNDLPLLFSHLHGLALQRPGAFLHVETFSDSVMGEIPAWKALQRAIQEAKAQMEERESEDTGL